MGGETYRIYLRRSNKLAIPCSRSDLLWIIRSNNGSIAVIGVDRGFDQDEFSHGFTVGDGGLGNQCW